MTTLRKRVKCGCCNGTGLVHEVGPNDDMTAACSRCGGDTDWSRNSPRIIRKGRGHVDLHFLEGAGSCRGCEGTGKIEVTWTKTGFNFLGQRTRKSWNEVIECPDCLGGKHALFEIETHRCKICDGRKTVKQWVKGFFGGEVEKDVPCSSCKGQGTYTQPSQRPFRGVA